MRPGEFSVLDALALRSARRFGSHLRLVMRQHEGWRRRVIWFHFDSPFVAEGHRALCAIWRAENTHLAFVHGPLDAVLLDMRSLLARAL
jgi:hypothetical protein